MGERGWYDDNDFDDDAIHEDDDDEPELIIVCPDDMCRGSFDGEGPPCGKWRDSCVRFKTRPPTTIAPTGNVDGER